MAQLLENLAERFFPFDKTRRSFLKLGIPVLAATTFSSGNILKSALTGNLYDSLLSSLIQGASSGRNYDIVDEKLNHDRFNILLFNHGELYERSIRDTVTTMGSLMIVSFGRKSIDYFTLSHEISSPEVVRYLQAIGKFDGYAKTIDQAYFQGGFDLLRLVVQSATGLSVDAQLAMNETVVADAIDKLYDGKVKVDVPCGFDTEPFYFKGQRYPEGRFSQGEEEMNGLRAIQYMKTISGTKYSKEIENTARKHVLLEAVSRTFESSDRGPLFWWKTASLLYEKLRSGELSYDANIGSLILSMIGPFTQNNLNSLKIPKTGLELYVSDPGNSNFAEGRKGVQWVSASQNPIFVSELELGFYKRQPEIKVPFDHINSFLADPDSENLIYGYWLPVREGIKQALLVPEFTD